MEGAPVDDAAKIVKLPAGVAGLWHVNKYHPRTSAMVVPLCAGANALKKFGLETPENEPDWCQLLIRTETTNGGAVAVHGVEMAIADALNILNTCYKQTPLVPQPF